MKFQVQVGQEFPCYVAEDPASSVVVNITQQPLPVTGDGSKPSPHKPRWGTSTTMVVGMALVLIALLPSFALAALTGDLAPLRSLAQVSVELMRAGIDFLRPP